MKTLLGGSLGTGRQWVAGPTVTPRVPHRILRAVRRVVPHYHFLKGRRTYVTGVGRSAGDIEPLPRTCRRKGTGVCEHHLKRHEVQGGP